MKKEVVVQKNPKSPISEIFRTLRTNIQFINSKKSLKTLLITSTLPGEGKSWVSANLAVTFAEAGKKVLLIDADMRKGRQHTIFGVNNDCGLSNLLSGVDRSGRAETIDISKYVQATEVQNLFVISKGDTPPNPSELLASDTTLGMLTELESIFDLIILDGPPSLSVTDALIISRLVDSTIIVVEYNNTKKDNLAKIKRDIENVGGKIAGVVINKIPKQGNKYESTYYYSSETRMTNIDKRKGDYRQLERKKNNGTAQRKQEILEEINQYINKDRK